MSSLSCHLVLLSLVIIVRRVMGHAISKAYTSVKRGITSAVHGVAHIAGDVVHGAEALGKGVSHAVVDVATGHIHHLLKDGSDVVTSIVHDGQDAVDTAVHAATHTGHAVVQMANGAAHLLHYIPKVGNTLGKGLVAVTDIGHMQQQLLLKGGKALAHPLNTLTDAQKLVNNPNAMQLIATQALQTGVRVANDAINAGAAAATVMDPETAEANPELAKVLGYAKKAAKIRDKLVSQSSSNFGQLRTSFHTSILSVSPDQHELIAYFHGMYPGEPFAVHMFHRNGAHLATLTFRPLSF